MKYDLLKIPLEGLSRGLQKYITFSILTFKDKKKFKTQTKKSKKSTINK